MGVGCAYRYIKLYVPNQHTQRPTQNLGSSNNSNKNTPPTNNITICRGRVFKEFLTFLFWLVALVAHVAKHNIECVFIHSMLSFDQKRRLFVDRWFFLFHRVCTIPVGIFMYILVMYLQIKSFNIYVHARWNEINLFHTWVISWFQLKTIVKFAMEMDMVMFWFFKIKWNQTKSSEVFFVMYTILLIILFTFSDRFSKFWWVN